MSLASIFSSTTPTQPSALPPVCDADCQRQKKISGLITALESKSLTKDIDPVGYQQARTAYYIEVEGPDWLEKEKQRILIDEIEPVMNSYRTQFDTLKDDRKSQVVFANLINSLKSDQTANDEELRHLNKKFQKYSDKADVLNRLNELNPQETKIVHKKSYLPTIIDVILAVLGIFIVYTLYRKFAIATGMVGGKRVLNKLIR